LNFEGITIHDFVQRHKELLAANHDALCMPTLQRDSSDKILGRENISVSDQRLNQELLIRDMTNITDNIRAFTKKMDEWLSDTASPDHEACKEIIHDLFMKKTLPVSFRSSGELHKSYEETGVRSNAQFLIGRPYFDMIAENKHGLFSEEDRTFLFNVSRGAPRSMNFWRKTYHYKKPENVDELRAALANYKDIKSEDKEASIIDQLDGATTVSATINAAASELAIYCHEHPKLDLAPIMAEFPKVFSVAVKARKGELFNTDPITQPAAIAANYIKRSFKLPADNALLGPLYLSMTDANVFPDEKWRAKLVEDIVGRFSKVKDVDERIHLAETLLLSNREVRDADIRRQVTDIWVKACQMKYKKDTGTQNYMDKIEPVIKRVSEGGVFNIRHEMLRQLCDSVVSQKELSHACEKTVYADVDRSKLTSVGMMLGATQGVIDSMSQSRRSREATMKFLMKPVVEEELNRFADNLANLMDTSGEASPKEKRILRTECRRIHENFWSLPLPARTLAMKHFLLPANERSYDGTEDEKTFQNAANFAMEHLLPLDESKFVVAEDMGKGFKRMVPNKEQEDVVEARRFLSAFLAPGVLDQNQRPLFIAALMSAAQRSAQEGGKVRIGQRLATLLDMMGPAWKKLGQAISSHPDTPRDIAMDMEPLKGTIDMPRWQMWGLFQNTVPQELQDEHTKLGPILGSASFFTTVDAGKSVFSLQSPYARERSQDGFSTMERFIEELKNEKYGFASAVSGSVTDMVHSAHISAALESTGRVGAAQAKALARRYNGTSIEIGDKTYEFEAAQWYDHGPEFRRMKKMGGKTFNDLANAAGDDPQKQEHVHGVAKAVTTVELMHNTDGGVADVDRHGRNFTVDGNKIGMFDVGATHAIIRDRVGRPIDPTDIAKVEDALDHGGTVEVYEPGHRRHRDKGEMELLGNALTEVLKSIKDGGQFTDAVHEQIMKARAQGRDPEHLIRTERALLSLQDCLSELSHEKKDHVDIFAALYRQKLLHPDIREVIEARVASGELGEPDAEQAAMLDGAMKFGIGKGEAMLGYYLGQNSNEVITISPGRSKDLPEPKYWPMPRNEKEISSLCDIEDIAKKTPPKQEKPEPKKEVRGHKVSASFVSAVRSRGGSASYLE